jgi:hypothetical protein
MRSDVGCLRFSDGWSLFWAHHRHSDNRHSDNYYLINRLSRAPSERQDRYREVGLWQGFTEGPALLLVNDGQPAPYPSLAVRARNGRVADKPDTTPIRGLYGV